MSSCDIVEQNYEDLYFVSDTLEGTNGGDTVEIVKRKILIIDFTAHKCNNCPDAHETILQIQNIYQDKIIPIAIHGTAFANPSSSYPTDFRTDVGTEIIDEFGVTSIPIGLVNYFSKDYLSSYSAWTDEVTTIVETEPEIKIEIENSLSDKQLTTNITCTALLELDKNLKLCVYLLESGIIAKQMDHNAPQGYIEDYEHSHVLRAAISDTWGLDILTGTIVANDEDSKELTFTLDDNWSPDNCSVVAFIYDNDTKEILNVEEAHLTE